MKLGRRLLLLDSFGQPQRVEPGDFVFSCFGCVGAGWSWALHVCHMLLLRAMCMALGAFGLSGDAALARVVIDGRKGTILCKGKPVCFPYVDNSNTATWYAYDAAKMEHSLSHVFNSLGLRYRVECSGESCWA